MHSFVATWRKAATIRQPAILNMSKRLAGHRVEEPSMDNAPKPEQKQQFNGRNSLANNSQQLDKDSTTLETLRGEIRTELVVVKPENNALLANVDLPDRRGNNEHIPIRVHPSLLAELKKHQMEGIKFLYNCTIESLDRLENDEESGGGAILGHCMGLGKTLTVIAFLHTILTHTRIAAKINKVLVVVPKNVVLNWMAEFRRWLPEKGQINFTELDSYKENSDRLKAIRAWKNFEGPAVLIVGYEMYRILTLLEEDFPKELKAEEAKKIMKKKEKELTAKGRELAEMKPELRELLHGGPHMVICDEGHKLKNCNTGIFCTMSKIATKRRICMTGTPLQNNLEEYYCMVNFVKPNLLGTPKEYKHYFVDIINQGRAKDASDEDVFLMHKRCHVLFEHLKGVLDRRDDTVLRDSLPSKQDYVINPQIDLYRKYLEFVKASRTQNWRELGRKSEQGMRLIRDHIMLYRIWTHPYLLLEHERWEEERKRRAKLGEHLDEADFVVALENEGEEESDDLVMDDSDEDLELEDIDNGNPDRSSTSKSAESAPEMEEWSVKPFVSEEDRNAFEQSHKLLLLVEIIKKCEQIGDKLLVFSQFLQSLHLIERMLAHMANNNDLWFVDGHRPLLMAQGEQWAWQRGLDYEVIKGKVSSLDRDRIQRQFNDPGNKRNRLLLLSTKAASLGTNLIGANRVVIFDCCWNPSQDTQSLFRVYRFGQTKPVYIYRFVAQGTMEERIYNRQVTKESIAKRVTQSAQIERHYTTHELEEIYDFEPEMPVNMDPSDVQGRQRLDPPKDQLLDNIILKGKGTNAVVSYHSHDPLFDEFENEKLTDEEREEACREYRRERGKPRLP